MVRVVRLRARRFAESEHAWLGAEARSRRCFMCEEAKVEGLFALAASGLESTEERVSVCVDAGGWARPTGNLGLAHEGEVRTLASVERGGIDGVP